MRQQLPLALLVSFLVCTPSAVFGDTKEAGP